MEAQPSAIRTNKTDSEELKRDWGSLDRHAAAVVTVVANTHARDTAECKKNAQGRLGLAPRSARASMLHKANAAATCSLDDVDGAPH